MKRKVFFMAAAMAALCLASCSDEASVNDSHMVNVRVNLKGFTVDTEPMTRSSSVTDFVTHLDVWIYESGTEFCSAHQTSVDAAFGSINLTLDNRKSYTLYAVAHKADGATISDGVISFADNKVTHSFFTSWTFTPTDGMTLDLMMRRIVAQLRFETTDAVPDWCKVIRFTVPDVFDHWNVEGYGVNELDRVSTINITSKNQDGTVTCNVYAIVSSTSTTHDVLVEALDADGNVCESHTIPNLPLINNQRTIVRGAFFTDASSTFSFLAEDWGADINVTF